VENLLSNDTEDDDVWTQVALNDNQAIAQTIFAENRKMVKIEYAIRRGTGNTEGGNMYIVVPEDLSAVAYSPTTVQVGDTGVTLIGAVSGVNIQLQYTTTSTGEAAILYYQISGPT
jgi:hypothetical protein